MTEHKQPIPAEQAYLAAQDLEVAGRTEEALAAYQSIIDDNGSSLWSDSAAQAMNRIAEGVPLTTSLRQARDPSCKRFTRSLSPGHALITAVIVALMAAAVGPLVAGSWVVLVTMDLMPVPVIYMVGAMPAGLAGLLFAAWVLGHCHLKGYMPERVKLAGTICGALAVAVSGWVLVPMVSAHSLPDGAVVFLIVHGMVGGMFMGWLGGKLVWYRVDRDAPPYSTRQSR
ncbi:hypothetical protein ACFOZ5_10610 [Marinobacter lacisalsi]|uniref:Tetratricopeptide repeat protein n=1 Tax=Marinobacter lacisalsi TaxID=475979 RepID=A0ABV8QIG5_9GAMM